MKFQGFLIHVAMDLGSNGTGWGQFGKHLGPSGMAWRFSWNRLGSDVKAPGQKRAAFNNLGLGFAAF